MNDPQTRPRTPWGAVGLALGVASVLGLPFTAYAILTEKIAWFVGVPLYGAGVAATAGTLFAARRGAKATAPTGLSAGAPTAGAPAAGARPTPERGTQPAARDTAMAATGLGLAATGCGAMVVFTVALVLLALALFAALIWYVGKYFLQLW